MSVWKSRDTWDGGLKHGPWKGYIGNYRYKVRVPVWFVNLYHYAYAFVMFR